MTFPEYVSKLRMEKAKKLLIASSLSIAEVAEQAGYSDYFYFNKLFKKMFGISPTKFRKDPIRAECPSTGKFSGHKVRI